ncbi:heterokaryon incompatibility protein-domain-containing protein [Aspergillus pseudotamarii]|uniref:Heterokaryon incompatibility protein-domain-containing protein n=1 Tax=Aspergillus pseudotamarii TaxID=132259 RepID=A0A5N6SAX1_ASPPS|nr:heterokaryon incompatibility protein-domain-containing protein [Aspergillus pseudotamarii]KAE8131107.1 heterokaryon incompatibility protein-domain-containing protein [Aspergillus pseudotamarii]
MHLLSTYTIELVEFPPDRIPDYAILSHTWEEEEVLFTDMQHHTGRTKSAWSKVQGACAQARADGFGYIWIDTCCIDKSSSAELTEAINSMFTWYANAAVCYAYLSDVIVHTKVDLDLTEFEQSRWFTRGWTLQELLAPSEVMFFSRDWVRFGERSSLAYRLMNITRIDEAVLSRELPVFEKSIAQRMSWAARRQTTRPEDMAYCLMGIFTVNMPMLYGEGGEKAFLRLQEEIMKHSDDHTIFAWTDKSASPDDLHGLLASSPAHFVDSQDVIAYQQWEPTPPYAMTNRGLRIDLALHNPTQQWTGRDLIALLHCGVSQDIKGKDGYRFLAIRLIQLSEFDNRYARRNIGVLLRESVSSRMQTIYVPQTNTVEADTRKPLGHVIFHMTSIQIKSRYRLKRIASPTVEKDIEKIRLDLTSPPTGNVFSFSSLNSTKGIGNMLAFLVWKELNMPLHVVIGVGYSPDFGLGFNAIRLMGGTMEFLKMFNDFLSSSEVPGVQDLQPMGRQVYADNIIVCVSAREHTETIPRHYALDVSIREERTNFWNFSILPTRPLYS